MKTILNEEIKYIRAGIDTIKEVSPDMNLNYKINLFKINRLIKKPRITIDYMKKVTNAYFFIVEIFEELESLTSEKSMTLVKTIFCHYFYWYSGDEKKSEYFTDIVRNDKMEIKKIIIDKNFEKAKLSAHTQMKESILEESTN